MIKTFIRDSLESIFLPCSESAINLLTMIALHESGNLLYVKQKRGPALSLWQMEEPAFSDVRRYVGMREERFNGDLVSEVLKRPFQWLNFDQVFACRCARVYLMMKPEQLPPPDDIEQLAIYAKEYWNTHKGKAKVSDYEKAYKAYYESVV